MQNIHILYRLVYLYAIHPSVSRCKSMTVLLHKTFSSYTLKCRTKKKTKLSARKLMRDRHWSCVWIKSQKAFNSFFWFVVFGFFFTFFTVVLLRFVNPVVVVFIFMLMFDRYRAIRAIFHLFLKISQLLFFAFLSLSSCIFFLDAFFAFFSLGASLLRSITC